MKYLSKLPVLTGLCAGLGLICLCIRQWLLQGGTDEKGLLISGHPGIFLSVLILAAVVCLLCLSLRQRQVYRFNNSTLSIVSMLFSAIGYGYAAWKLLFSHAYPLYVVTGLLGIISVLCALFIAFSLFRKLRVHPLVYCPFVLFFLFFLICRYQQWSGEPELQRYLFQMLGVISLMMAAYHRAALAADKKGARNYLLLSRAAVFFCIAAIPGSAYGILYGCAAAAIILDGFTAKQQGA